MTPDQLTARIIEIHALMRHADPTGQEAAQAFASLWLALGGGPRMAQILRGVNDAYVEEQAGMEDGYAVEELIDLARARDRAWARLSEAVASHQPTTNGEHR